MAKIILDIDESNINTVKSILENLKDGLIKNMEVQQRRYVGKQKPLEDEFLPKNSTSTIKYLSPSEFKNRQRK